MGSSVDLHLLNPIHFKVNDDRTFFLFFFLIFTILIKFLVNSFQLKLEESVY